MFCKCKKLFLGRFFLENHCLMKTLMGQVLYMAEKLWIAPFLWYKDLFLILQSVFFLDRYFLLYWDPVISKMWVLLVRKQLLKANIFGKKFYPSSDVLGLLDVLPFYDYFDPQMRLRWANRRKGIHPAKSFYVPPSKLSS